MAEEKEFDKQVHARALMMTALNDVIGKYNAANVSKKGFKPVEVKLEGLESPTIDITHNGQKQTFNTGTIYGIYNSGLKHGKKLKNKREEMRTAKFKLRDDYQEAVRLQDESELERLQHVFNTEQWVSEREPYEGGLDSPEGLAAFRSTVPAAFFTKEGHFTRAPYIYDENTGESTGEIDESKRETIHSDLFNLIASAGYMTGIAPTQKKVVDKETGKKKNVDKKPGRVIFKTRAQMDEAKAAREAAKEDEKAKKPAEEKKEEKKQGYGIDIG